jgi:16S rRNA (cytosine967-C5)-methyltransferase
MPTPREIVLHSLLLWQNPQDPPFLPERTDPYWAPLSPRDRAFAFDLLTGILRWRNTLDALIASRLRQPLDSLDHPIRALLWLGTYQLLFQGGTADYAAVDTTVDLAKKSNSTAKASGLVNAVLRGITRLNPQTHPRVDKRPGSNTFALDFDTAITLSAKIFPNPDAAPDGHLAAARSHPVAYVQHLRKLFGQEQAGELLLRNNLRPVVTLRVDTAAIDIPTSAGLIPHGEAKQFLVAAEGWNPLIEQLVEAGTLSPQDPTSAKPIRVFSTMVDDKTLPSPMTILDLCAGLGTKSLQLARAFPHAIITATDIDAQKIARLRARAAHMKLTNLTTVLLSELPPPPHQPFDLVLLDVPCSNTGVMAKRVQSRWRWPSLDHAALHTLQIQLLTQGAAHTPPHGLLIYATCSLDPAENENLVAAFLEKSPRTFKILAQQSTLPSLTNAPATTHDGGHFTLLGPP